MPSKSKAGKVYFLEAKFKNGRTKIYTGQTGRSVYTRIGEHINNIKNGNTSTYTGRAESVKLLGSVYSKNRFKAERTIKSLSPEEKRSMARSGASRFKKNYS